MLPIPCLHWLREQAAERPLSIKREMLDAKHGSESHTYHEQSEQLTNKVSQAGFSLLVNYLYTRQCYPQIVRSTWQAPVRGKALWIDDKKDFVSEFSLRE